MHLGCECCQAHSKLDQIILKVIKVCQCKTLVSLFVFPGDLLISHAKQQI